ncbi:hypothetical protein BATDEDRAFT_23226 [Batrachochytrium dendrobatidis JAM81]|uniref:Uncharacterized protein n=1 Tax=Batrachochytrium dendrobatidis (strain JAM81 / FGSC 10211) TaxID=684364 RepID=F4NYD1_BATDJ|nr:uncharacterized protein BATDEDRAFT_23226 [Batrachochytrium dendrobatidis JAM81]EGF81693.1 hypothetical protein BATDEDRAFT_23226 [Batrachochytrium dendrobatidis JAM81]|eukprot:XP_006677228.1 hypothetical protein BATDEDRAFT_23226 [Batrachochytrium dendrobatidis JAM81]
MKQKYHVDINTLDSLPALGHNSLVLPCISTKPAPPSTAHPLKHTPNLYNTRRIHQQSTSWSRWLLTVVTIRALTISALQIAFLYLLSVSLNIQFGTAFSQGAGMTIIYSFVFITYECYNVFLIMDAVKKLNTPQTVGVTFLMSIIGLYSALQLQQINWLESCTLRWRDATVLGSTNASLATQSVVDEFGTDLLCASPSYITASTTQFTQVSLHNQQNMRFPVLNGLNDVHNAMNRKLGHNSKIIIISAMCVVAVIVFDALQITLAYKIYKVQGWDVLRQHGASIQVQCNMMYRLKLFFMVCNVIQISGAILILTTFSTEFTILVRDPIETSRLLNILPLWGTITALQIMLYSMTTYMYCFPSVKILQCVLLLTLANILGLGYLTIVIWSFPMLVIVQFWFTFASSGVVMLDIVLFVVAAQALVYGDVDRGLKHVMHSQSQVFPEQRMILE